MDSGLKRFVYDFLKVNDSREGAASIEPLPGDGSKRRFWRMGSLGAGKRFIVMANPPVNQYAYKENNAYIEIGKHLKSKGVPVPRIYLFSPEKGWVIMEDLGRPNLQEVVKESENPLPIYRKVVKELLHLQLKGAEGFNVEWCCQTASYDHTVMRRDESHYFRDAFLGTYMGFNKEWSDLEVSFRHLAAMASQANSGFFLYRDFQSRNILVDKGRIGLVDWQGGRMGPLGYDLASLLIDPYTALSLPIQKEIYHFYLSLLAEHDPGLLDDFAKYYPYLSLQRNLQILGAFAYLSKVQGKAYFEDYIPGALKSLSRLLDEVKDPELDPLREVFMTLPQPGS
ncbi:MAG: phosphotransferase [Desulfatiglandaceae bacterium]